MNRYYVVSIIKSHIDVKIFDDIEIELNLRWAKDMIGIMPVFETKKSAKEYAKLLGVDSIADIIEFSKKEIS